MLKMKSLRSTARDEALDTDMKKTQNYKIDNAEKRKSFKGFGKNFIEFINN